MFGLDTSCHGLYLVAGVYRVHLRPCSPDSVILTVEASFLPWTICYAVLRIIHVHVILCAWKRILL